MRVCYSSEAKTKFFNCFFVMMACFEAEDAATMRWLFLIVTLVVTLVAAAYFGYKGLMWLSDWMDEVEEQRDREP
jgi:NF-X1-type zinc finger protein NFXL1